MKPKSELQMIMYLKRIDQKSVSEVLGKDRSTISRWLKNPTPEHTKVIMDAIEQIEAERGEES